MLPFLTILMSVWYIWKGRPKVAIGWWMVTMVVYIIWFAYHITSELNLSF
ncbi:DUF5993 family protein [Microbulbifer epialgicus]|uniref:DUF5993 family protein n=1 Tax=Microbulbifer epialgicus TaxID=393907 RepID=A0ABV4NWK8_9GAMM